MIGTFELHFTPKFSRWVNVVELFFGRLTEKAIRRGIVHSVPPMIDAGPGLPHRAQREPTAVPMHRHPPSRSSHVRRGHVHPRCNQQLKPGQTTRSEKGGGLFLRVSQRFGSRVDHEDLDHSVGIEEDLAVVVDHFAA